MRYTVAIVMLLLAGLSLRAQQKGTIRFFVDPGHNFEFILDGNKRMKQKAVELTTGPHSFTFWAPGRSIVDTTINVIEGDQSFYLRLPYSLSFMAYERQTEKFKGKLIWYRSVPLGVTILTGVISGVNYGRARRAGNDLDDLLVEYDNSLVPSDILRIKSEVEEANETLADRRTSFGVSAGIFAASALATVYLFRKSKGLEAPVFQDKAKVKFDGLVYVPGIQDQGMLQAGISLTWNR